MTNQKHTPGPWKVVGTQIQTLDYKRICECYDELEYSINSDECEANTRLIAASPEMLSFLDDLFSRYYDSFELADVERFQEILEKTSGKG